MWPGGWVGKGVEVVGGWVVVNGRVGVGPHALPAEPRRAGGTRPAGPLLSLCECVEPRSGGATCRSTVSTALTRS